MADPRSRQDKKASKLCEKNPNWSHDVCLAVANGRVLIGMDVEMVQAALGRPLKINSMYTAGHTEQLWTYGHDAMFYQGRELWDAQYWYVYFTDGIVSAVQN
jgi:hypothetical protein